MARPKGIKDGPRKRKPSQLKELGELLDQCPHLLKGEDCENCPKKIECLDVFTSNIPYKERTTRLKDIMGSFIL